MVAESHLLVRLPSSGGGAKTVLGSVVTLRHCELEHSEQLVDVVC